MQVAWEVTRWGLFLVRGVQFFFEFIAYGKAEMVAEGWGIHSRFFLMKISVLIRGPRLRCSFKRAELCLFRWWWPIESSTDSWGCLTAVTHHERRNIPALWLLRSYKHSLLSFEANFWGLGDSGARVLIFAGFSCRWSDCCKCLEDGKFGNCKTLCHLKGLVEH